MRNEELVLDLSRRLDYLGVEAAVCEIRMKETCKWDICMSGPSSGKKHEEVMERTRGLTMALLVEQR